MTCPRFAFRCVYGACVNGNAECNGRKDCADNSDELSPKCPSKTLEANRGNCKWDEYQCQNGDCISNDDVCDGINTCADGSDEIIERCASITCPAFAFRCGYGACVSGRAKCNGTNECEDGSDENYLLCNYPKPVVQTTTVSPISTSTLAPISPYACRITKLPKNGFAGYLSNPNEHLGINDVVDNFVSVEYSCTDNHVVIGNTTNICISGQWQFDIPECKPRCTPNDIFSITFVANCYRNENGSEKQVRCTEPAKPGTIARINCQRGYENVKAAQQVISCSDDGRWRPAPNTCTQICGEEGPEGTPYVVGGSVANITKVPWHVGIYKQFDTSFQQWCGGTILNAKVVISAMHCFWDRSEDKPFDYREFRVVAGKFKRDYTAVEDLKTQVFSLAGIHYLEEEYIDLRGLYANDIVLLVLNSYIEYKAHVAPICIEYGLYNDDRIVTPGWIGRVAGWGLEESSGQPSPVLKLIELPAVSRSECTAKSSKEFIPFITSDKFCAGYLTGLSVCQGDSGGGLVFPKTVGEKTTYYIRGIVSTGANKANSCDNDKYTTFTNIAYFLHFIANVEIPNRPI